MTHLSLGGHGTISYDTAADDAPARVLGPGHPDYETRRWGFNTVLEHHPALIVEARCAADVVAGVRLATAEGRAVAVMATGHGPSRPADDAVLIRTDCLADVAVNPEGRTARVGAGARWGDVIAAATPHGLAPLNGTSPHVGVTGYTLGGGIGLLSRRYGFAADHVSRLDVVTADGELRRVSAGDAGDADLFWAMRGAGANFGVVTELEIELFPVAELLGGELCFGPGSAGDVAAAYVEWAADAPDTMASSLLLAVYPDDPAVPAGLRGRHITHVRVADSAEGHDAEGHLDASARVDELRAVGPRVVDTVGVMPYAEVGSIHHEPVDEPVPAYDRNVLLSRLGASAAAVLVDHAGPDGGGFLAELRAWVVRCPARRHRRTRSVAVTRPSA